LDEQTWVVVILDSGSRRCDVAIRTQHFVPGDTFLTFAGF